VDSNVARDIKPPKVMRRIISTLSDEETRGIFKTFDPTNQLDYRNETILMLLLDTGLRMSTSMKGI
jgi:site-specific recombinase XerD